ncbi:MAG: dihydroorotate dehydrogenase electron transfer subunit [Planctomycetes bacterium]|nr:dihydroorotate dehydrogenase electron transfer subunit [Planctomycetota bacterium]
MTENHVAQPPPAAVSPQTALPVMLEIAEVRRENATAKTLLISLESAEDQPGLILETFTPGQFVMVWVPRMDEKPYALSYLEEGRAGITVHRRGPFSKRLCEMRAGERIGLRGAYGRGFWDVGERAPGASAAIIGGGCGMAVLAPLAERLPEATLVQGARSADGLFFTDRFPGQVIFTDDGSAGRHGLPTEWLVEAVADGAVEAVYTCGPEPMMARVVELCRGAGLPCQASIERYMKCGIGVCGQCDCDGRRVCVEGPVFSGEELARMPSFGRRRRDKTGRQIPVE